MWKCACDICGKEMIPLDAIPFRIKITTKANRCMNVVKVAFLTKGYVDGENLLFNGDVCRDCRKALINRFESDAYHIIEQLKQETRKANQ